LDNDRESSELICSRRVRVVADGRRSCREVQEEFSGSHATFYGELYVPTLVLDQADIQYGTPRAKRSLVLPLSPPCPGPKVSKPSLWILDLTSYQNGSKVLNVSYPNYRKAELMIDIIGEARKALSEGRDAPLPLLSLPTELLAILPYRRFNINWA